MQQIVLGSEIDFEGWRLQARRLAAENVPPEEILWQVGAEATDLFVIRPDERPVDERADEAEPADAGSAAPGSDPGFRVPRAFLELAQDVVQAREPTRFALLYAMLWRFSRGERHLLEQTTDATVQRVQALAKAVRYATHKMRAFVRFREVSSDGAPYYVAWFEPEHYIVEANAPFFMRRFAGMNWSILTPYRSVAWDGATLAFGPGALRSAAPDGDALEELWRSYFASTFNPARLKVQAMVSQMPRRYWKNLPEAELIPGLVRTAGDRAAAMVADRPTAPSPRQGRVAVPQAPTAPAILAHAGTTLADTAQRAARCQACPLWEPATQTVFGEGPADAPIMLIGEQPGDQEDLAGRPFVGPAGQLLDRALAEAGMERRSLYVTNAVKHFKFEPRGKRRIHSKPNAAEITACAGWLAEERAIVRPTLLVLLGASAIRAVLHREVSVTRERGRLLALEEGVEALMTVHPSYLLRLPDPAQKAAQYAAFVADLKLASTRMPAAV